MIATETLAHVVVTAAFALKFAGAERSEVTSLVNVDDDILPAAGDRPR